jgi:hypothetical protein
VAALFGALLSPWGAAAAPHLLLYLVGEALFVAGDFLAVLDGAGARISHQAALVSHC